MVQGQGPGTTRRGVDSLGTAARPTDGHSGLALRASTRQGERIHPDDSAGGRDVDRGIARGIGVGAVDGAARESAWETDEAVGVLPAGSLDRPARGDQAGKTTGRECTTGMRLWSLHPKYLDPQGLVALWREALLAKAVLRGETRGYTHHPQLERFAHHSNPRAAIDAYLASVHAEALRQAKLETRSPALLAQWSSVATPACHLLFRRRPGPVASWERAKSGG